MSWLASACIVLSLAAAQAAPSDAQQKSGDAQQQHRQQQPPPANRVINRPQPPPADRTPNPNKSEIRPDKHSASAANGTWPTREDVKRWLSWKPEFGWAEIVALGAVVVAAGSAAVSFLTLIVTGWFLRYTYLMWTEMVRQNNNAERDREESKGSTEESQRSTQESLKLTRQQLEAYERPWVTATFAIDGDIDTLYDGAATLQFQCALCNIGQSVATDIQAVGELISPPFEDGSTPRKQIKAVQPPPFDGYALFPNDPETKVIHAWLSRDNAERGVVRVGEHEFIYLRFVGVVFYRIPNSESLHRTGVVYKLRRPRGDEPQDFEFILGERLDQFAD